MRFDVSILSTDEYSPEDIVGELIPEKYIYDEPGEVIFTSTNFNSEETVSQLIKFLFQSPQFVEEVYRNKNAYVLDLSLLRKQLIDFDYLEKFYPKWLEDTGRDTSMNEYGMLIDFIGYAKKGINKKNLLMIVSSERHSS